MQELTGENYNTSENYMYNTSEQHKDTFKSRQQRDTEDTYKLIVSLLRMGQQLHNLVSGVAAHDKVNVDNSRWLGKM